MLFVWNSFICLWKNKAMDLGINTLIEKLDNEKDYLLIMLLKQKLKDDYDLYLTKHTLTDKEYRVAKTSCKPTLNTIHPTVKDMFPKDKYPDYYTEYVDIGGYKWEDISNEAMLIHSNSRINFYDKVLDESNANIVDIIKCKAIIIKINNLLSYNYNIMRKY